MQLPTPAFIQPRRQCLLFTTSVTDNIQSTDAANGTRAGSGEKKCRYGALSLSPPLVLFFPYFFSFSFLPPNKIQVGSDRCELPQRFRVKPNDFWCILS